MGRDELSGTFLPQRRCWNGCLQRLRSGGGLAEFASELLRISDAVAVTPKATSLTFDRRLRARI
ncbi:hypothetical protein B0H19DRAFT_1148621 [Mycena capillaripes]|nr:hypothetical protein B0H19DRAFT_1148621 [Mycena capillaripes]